MKYCTLTGADDSASIDDLWALGRKFPFVEWGVLYSIAQQGHGRYPSFDWIDHLTERMDLKSGPGFALHICGRAVGEFLSDTNMHLRRITRDLRYFRRIQLNFRAGTYDPGIVKAGVARHPYQTIITQHNPVNAPLLPFLAGARNHAVLFDGSGGRSIRCNAWAPTLSGVECGYAGGLGPDNLGDELPRIHQAANGQPYWIDMEGSLRNGSDRFDLGQATRCLEHVRTFLQSNDLAPYKGWVLKTFRPLPPDEAEALEDYLQ